MRTCIRLGLVVALALVVCAGCDQLMGGGKAHSLILFNNAWAKCHSLSLYEASVESVTMRPDGNRRVVVKYLFDNGMMPDSGRAAMLLTPDNQLASQCIVDLLSGTCLCGGERDWRDDS